MDGQILVGDVRAVLPTLAAESVQVCVTSPPYFGLRSYLPDGHPDKALELGAEPTVEAYVAQMVVVFREVKRVLKPDGTLWVNWGDSFSRGRSGRADGGRLADDPETWKDAIPPALTDRQSPGYGSKQLLGIPWRCAFALQADDWWLRSDIIWSKKAPMPESVTDRPTRAHEYLFLLAKAERYYYDAAAIAEPAVSDHGSGNGYKRPAQISRNGRGSDTPYEPQETRNKRSVWTLGPDPYPLAHFATFPEALIEPCILAGSRPGDVVLDPFFGSGTTGAVCERLGRNWIGIELSEQYAELARRRTAQRGFALA